MGGKEGRRMGGEAGEVRLRGGLLGAHHAAEVRPSARLPPKRAAVPDPVGRGAARPAERGLRRAARRVHAQAGGGGRRDPTDAAVQQERGSRRGEPEGAGATGQGGVHPRGPGRSHDGRAVWGGRAGPLVPVSENGGPRGGGAGAPAEEHEPAETRRPRQRGPGHRHSLQPRGGRRAPAVREVQDPGERQRGARTPHQTGEVDL
mmetsp:Transcript_36061/g.64523  ORF Transcript_36061/g.64523 Transcript_36061/m.64523 type:complete len:204 (+) Transcript_36061:785-1396(+)